MAERVVSLEVGVEWEPNAPDAVLISQDVGDSLISLRAHFDDPDQRCVVFRWVGVRSATMSAPNDEAISGHRLSSRGLSGLLWAGQVLESSLIDELERQNRVHPYHDGSRFMELVHHIVLTKERTVEVIARSLTVGRHDGPTMAAAIAASHV